MIQVRDWIMLGLMLGAMAVGFIWPQAGAPFQPFPVYFMMTMLFMSFLSISLRSIASTVHEYGLHLFGWLFFKLLALPVGLFYLFQKTWPEYALTALLLGGISTGVVAPFFSTLLGANTPLVVLMVTTSSLLVPFTLPMLVLVLVEKTLDISFLAMAKTLAQVIFAPLAAAEILRMTSPSIVGRIVSMRYPASLFLCAGIMLGIFSKYASYLHGNPVLLLHCLAISFVLAALFFIAGILISLGWKVPDRMAALISFGLINNILVVVFSSEFFGVIEPLVSMIYVLPFFCSIIFLRAYGSYLARDKSKTSRWK